MRASTRGWLFGAVAMALMIPACSGEGGPAGPDPDPDPDPGSLTLTVSTEALTVAPGDTGTVTAMHSVPSGYTGGVTIGISNWPSGITVERTSDVTTNTTVFSLIAAPDAAAASSTMNISVSATGFSGVTRQVAVSISN